MTNINILFTADFTSLTNGDVSVELCESAGMPALFFNTPNGVEKIVFFPQVGGEYSFEYRGLWAECSLLGEPGELFMTGGV